MACFKVRHLFDLLEEWNWLVEQATSVEIVDFSNELLVDSWCLHDVSDEATEESSCGVRCSNHEHKAFCLHFIDRDWATIGILGGEYVVKKVTSLRGFGVFKSLFEKLVSKLRWLSLRNQKVADRIESLISPP